MSSNLHNPFLGISLHNSVNVRNDCKLVHFDKAWPARRAFRRCLCAKQNNWIHQGSRFLHFCGRNIELLRQNFGSRSGLKAKCVKEPFSRSKALVRSFSPFWNEGLLLIRCSVFLAVISGACLLVWYGREKAKGIVEAKLLPSVCSVLSEYIQRELDFGKVRRISPLSITLESCSIGPHSKEFSCGEVPTLKLRVLPFASLRRGKIVIDAVLSHPSVLIVQKKDYTWLGIPSSEGSLLKHLSTEEGIDHRTKTRRTAREEVAACWARERDDNARAAAEMGYIVSEQASSTSEVDFLKEVERGSTVQAGSESFLCMDGKMHWRDHHCMDTGVEYDLKHADLEKSFGIKIPGSGLKFWSRIISGPTSHKFKRKPNGRDISATSVTSKRRVLERSASAALSYFQGLSRGMFGEPSQSSGGYDFMNLDTLLVKSEGDTNPYASVESSNEEEENGAFNVGGEKSTDYGNFKTSVDYSEIKGSSESGSNMKKGLVYQGAANTGGCNVNNESLGVDAIQRKIDTGDGSSRLRDQMLESLNDVSKSQRGHTSEGSTFIKLEPWLAMHHSIPIWPLGLKPGLPPFHRNVGELLSDFVAGPIQKLKSGMSQKVEDIVAELVEGVDEVQTEGIENMLPVTLDSVHFQSGTLMLLAYGDREPREMENVNGHMKFQNHYGRVHVQLSGNCKMWRSDLTSEDGGWLSADVFVDSVEQKWHANLKVANLFAPLFERILEIPIMWSKGRASGEVHLCMSRGETFPNLHGQLDVTGLAFQIFDAPSWFSDISASLCFRGQRIFLHNASGWFGDVPLEASGDFGIHPEEGEFHLMCQVPCVEVNDLMKTFKMKPLLFPLAGSVTAVFNCQGPLDAPIFVGSGMVSRKMAHSVSDFSASSASEAMMRNKEAGAVAAFDRVPFSYLSANFTFNTDNCVADLYGIRASLVDGGEIRGAGNAWICPEGEMDDTAVDVNFSGNLSFDKIMGRYLPDYLHPMPFKLGDINGETKLSGSLLRPKFDIKWVAPNAEGSFSDARGHIIISHDYITVNSSSVAFELYMKVLTSYPDEYWLNQKDHTVKSAMPLIVEGGELDLRMRGFEFFSLVSSYPFDSPRPMHLKATGRVKFQGKVMKVFSITNEKDFGLEQNMQDVQMTDKGNTHSLVGEVSISGLKLNQLMLAPQLVGLLSISRECIKLDATGRPDESFAVEVVGPLQPSTEENMQNGKLFSFSLQKGQLRANVCYRPRHLANLEVRNLPLDELELASLRGTIQRAELQLNLQKRRGHGILSVLRPKFSGVLGEALDVAARWSGDVITVEKTVLEQSNSRYELQGEYVLPGTRDRKPADKERWGFFKRAMAGHLGSVISSMGRWRMRLEVSRAEVTEMLPLARLLS